jgi:CheY-like chemotaxis protein
VALLIEDERQIRRFVRTALEAQSWVVHEAETLQQGLTDASTRRPDLVILDLGLPDGDGIDLLRDLRSWFQGAGHRALGAGERARQNRGARCGSGRLPGAIVNYLNYTYDSHDIWTWRTDYMNDSTGQRTGFKGAFVEFDLGYTHWVGDALELRPEARYEHQVSAPNAAATGYAYDNPCYAPSVPGVSSCTFSSGGRTLSFEQNGGKRSQAMLAMDAIFHF